MNPSAVITGAGSGVGEAVAVALARDGWNLALVGRRPALLEATRQRLVAARPGAVGLICPCDVADAGAVERMAVQVLGSFGAVDVLVNAAGTNTPQRALAVLSPADYHRLLETNLDGAYYCVQAFLPGMRQRRAGTIVNIVSDAGKQASPKAGPAYVMSKFGLAGLTQAINAEERANGVRACAIFPGDIDTPILNLRPAPPSPEARARMLQAEDVAAAVLLAIQLPARAIVEELVLRPA